MLSKALTRFKQAMPAATVLVEEGDLTRLLPRLRMGELDLIVGHLAAALEAAGIAIPPTAWTAHGTAAPAPIGFKSLRITLGTGSATHVDELRISTSWSAVVRTSAED